MSTVRVRPAAAVVGQVDELRATLRDGLERRSSGAGDPTLVDALWTAEGLGVLLWAFELVELPPFDHCFEPRPLLATPVDGSAELRDPDAIEHARASAALWHWRARTQRLTAESELELPLRWRSLDQLIGVAALRGHEHGLLPPPLDDDFPAFGRGYALASADEQLELLSIAYERHRALNWLCSAGSSWAETPTDT